jgi:6-pyruvoyltetrahydropterin/6-carboxytetrahydropterin synthase
MIKAIRYHDISIGHRVTNHESKCRHLHGHNYRVHFHCEAPSLDEIGRVIDFSVIKSTLCMWLEDNWDHHFLVYTLDPLAAALKGIDPTVVEVPFNPTAENIAIHLVKVVAPELLKDTGVTLVECIVDETRKCSASFSI